MIMFVVLRITNNINGIDCNLNSYINMNEVFEKIKAKAELGMEDTV